MNREKPFSSLRADRASCTIDEEHCITCGDTLLSTRVLSIQQERRCALIESEDSTQEVDISLVDEVAPGDFILVHGGVAIAVERPYMAGR